MVSHPPAHGNRSPIRANPEPRVPIAHGGRNVEHGAAFLEAPGGVSLRHAWWRQTRRPAPSAVLLHGRTECLEKHAETVSDLLGRGFDVFTLDWRGQGLSGPRLGRDPLHGHVVRYDDYLDDLDLWLDGFVTPRIDGPSMILAHSMGGHLALRHLARRVAAGSARADAAVLSAPMIDILPDSRLRRTTAPLVARGGVGVGLGRSAAFAFGGYGDPERAFPGNTLTSDKGRFAWWAEVVRTHPELRIAGGTFGWVHATFASIGRLTHQGLAESIDTPLLIVEAGLDRVVSNAAIRRLAKRLPRATRVVVDDARHELLMERNPLRDRFWGHFDGFAQQVLGASKSAD